MSKQISKEAVLSLIFVLVIIAAASMFNLFEKGLVSITGADVVAKSATATLNITSVTSINWTNSSLDWGTGSVNSGALSAALNSNDTINCTGNVPDGSWTKECRDLVLENTGSDRVNITISSDVSAATLTGGTNAGFQWKFWEEGNACYGTLSLTSFTTITAGLNTTLCTGLNYTTANDAISMDVNITVPNDATLSGQRTATFIATATTIP